MAVIHNDPVTQRSGRLLSDTNLLPDALAKNGAANILTVTDDGINRLPVANDCRASFCVRLVCRPLSWTALEHPPCSATGATISVV